MAATTPSSKIQIPLFAEVNSLNWLLASTMSNSSASSAGGYGLAAGITSSEAETHRGSLRVSSTTETTQDGSSSGGGSTGGAVAEGTTRSLSAVTEEAESGASPSGRGDQSLPPDKQLYVIMGQMLSVPSSRGRGA